MINQPLRIGMISPLYVPYGGVERHVAMIATELVKKNIQVQVLCVDPTGKLPKVEDSNGVVVRRFPSLGDNGFFFSPQLALWLHRHIHDFDLIHGHSYHTPLALQAGVVAHMHGVPFVFTPHYHGTGHTAFRKLLHIPYFAIGKWLVQQSSMNICVSKTEMELLKNHFGPFIRVRVIPNGIDTSLIDAAAPIDMPDNQKIVLTVGRLESYKRFDLVIQAMCHLSSEYHLMVVGTGADQPRLKELVEQLNLKERVKFLGRISDEELASWYRTAQVFVTLSLHEAFGLTLLEGIAGGCHVLASDIPAYREASEYAEPNLVSFIPLSATSESIAQSIAQSTANERGHSSQKLQHLSWGSITQQIMETYSNIAK